MLGVNVVGECRLGVALHNHHSSVVEPCNFDMRVVAVDQRRSVEVHNLDACWGSVVV